MIETFGIFWLRPVWLLGLPVALLAGILLSRRAIGLGAWQAVIDPALRATLARLGRIVPARGRLPWITAALLGLLAIALSGPAVERRDRPAYRNLDAVLIVMDLSPSVANSTRLEDLRTAGRLVASVAAGRQVGLIVFAGEAYLAGALTSDARALGELIAYLDAETVPVAGSRPAEALGLAAEVLDDADIIAADVILIGDGGGLGPVSEKMALRLSEAGARLSVLSPGDVDRTTLQRVAQLGGGRAGTLAAPEPVLALVASAGVARFAETDHALLFVEDRGRYLLVLALIPAFVLIRRGVA